MSSTSHTTTDRPHYKPLVTVLVAECVGIALDRWLNSAFALWYIGAVLSWLAWYVCWKRGRLQISAGLLLLSVAATGGVWHHCRWSLFPLDEVGFSSPDTPGPVALEVRALSGPRRIPAPLPDPLRTIATPERTRLEVEVLAVRNRDAWQPASGRASLIVAGNVVDIEPGDRLRAFAQWSSMRPPANPGEFDFAAQARSTRRLISLNAEFPESLERRERVGGWISWLRPSRLVDFLRTRGDALLWRNLGPSQAALGAAMFLGARDDLDSDLREAFVETGTIHLLVVSGLNVAILSTFLFGLMRLGLVPRGWTLVIVVLACLLYAAATDGQPPVVRATVMVLVSCLALMLGRRALGFNTLALAGLVVLAINPSELFQAGTQLSFLAVGVLIYVAQARWGTSELDPLRKLIAQTRSWPRRMASLVFRNLWLAGVTATLIWLVIAPLVMARFHLISPIAILVGPLVSLPGMVAMACGFGIFLFGWLVPPLGILLGGLCDYCLSGMQVCVELGRAMPGSHFWVAGPGDWWLAGFYGALACAMLVPRLRFSRQWTVGLAAGWIAIGFGVSLATSRDTDDLHCTFLSVGHGVAVVVELPGGQTLLYDVGRLGTPTGASRIVTSFLWSRGITHLDAVVISHADADHYNGLPKVLRQVSVGAVYVSPVMFDDSNSRAVQALREALQQSGVSVSEVWSGDRLRAREDLRIEVLHPPRRGVLGSDNANSIVLAIEYQGRRILLTGDLEPPGLTDVLAELPYDCDVTLAPHHGSAASDPPGFVAWSTPEWTVISGGNSDRVAAVSAAFASHGSQVLHTAERGAVTATISRGQVSVKGFRVSE